METRELFVCKKCNHLLAEVHQVYLVSDIDTLDDNGYYAPAGTTDGEHSHAECPECGSRDIDTIKVPLEFIKKFKTLMEEEHTSMYGIRMDDPRIATELYKACV